MNRVSALFVGFSVVASALSCVSFARGQDLADMLVNWDPSWPQRFGITGIGYSQEQNYGLDNLVVSAAPGTPPAVAPLLDDIDLGPLLSEIDNEVTQWGVKADFWILPFWNVHGMVGRVDGQTVVSLNEVAVAEAAQQGLNLPGSIEVDYEGTVFAAGSTLAYGNDWWFVSVTGVYAYTEVKGDIESIPSWLLMPRLGARLGKFEAWVGATCQNVSERQSGVFDLGLLAVNYDLELKASEPWNAQVGLRYSLSDSVFVTLEAGFGNRDSLSGHLEWRF